MATRSTIFTPSNESTLPRRLNRKQAAKYLGVATGTLNQWASNGAVRLPYYRVGSKAVYDTRDLDALLEKSRVGEVN